jgi:radical SAM protein with 4Fe4S-binding SPASM domain
VEWLARPWCAPASRLALDVGIAVSSGSVGVGVLSADQQRWLATSSFPAGFDGNASIAFDSGVDDRVFVVVYGVADGHLDASIDWREALEPPPVRHADTREAEAWTAGAAQTAPLAPAASKAEPPRERLSARLGRAIRGDVRYYCQKPWTDLHNFTVDGRMDVCCITTGESQARYGLGNLMTQSFQDVWNGARAREFRRTVNSDAPLPPCRRCPMAYAYQGPLFNPAGAERRLKKALAAVCKPLPFGGRLYNLSARVFPPLVSHTFFRGFKR